MSVLAGQLAFADVLLWATIHTVTAVFAAIGDPVPLRVSFEEAWGG